MWKFELPMKTNICVPLRKFKFLSYIYLQYKTYVKNQTFNNRHHGSMELARSWDKFFQSMQWALLAKKILNIFPKLSNGYIFKLVHTYQFFLYGHMLELTFKIIRFLVLIYKVHLSLFQLDIYHKIISKLQWRTVSQSKSPRSIYVTTYIKQNLDTLIILFGHQMDIFPKSTHKKREEKKLFWKIYDFWLLQY